MSHPGALKRQRELRRDERQKEKAARREQRKLEKAAREERVGEEDPDIAGIIPGPQPVPEE